MARKRQTLTVQISDQAQRDLEEIWTWNAVHWGLDQADAYVEKLLQVMEGLGRDSSKSIPIVEVPGLSRIVVRRRAKGHGHIVVFQIDRDVVTVVHVFHTAQDWLGRLS